MSVCKSIAGQALFAMATIVHSISDCLWSTSIDLYTRLQKASNWLQPPSDGGGGYCCCCCCWNARSVNSFLPPFDWVAHWTYNLERPELAHFFDQYVGWSDVTVICGHDAISYVVGGQPCVLCNVGNLFFAVFSCLPLLRRKNKNAAITLCNHRSYCKMFIS